MGTATKTLTVLIILLTAILLPLSATASATTDYDTVDWEAAKNRGLDILIGAVFVIAVILLMIAGIRIGLAGSDAQKRHDAYEGVKAIIIGSIIAFSAGGIIAVIRYVVFG